jgi:hypothetical protein
VKHLLSFPTSTTSVPAASASCISELILERSYPVVSTRRRSRITLSQPLVRDGPQILSPRTRCSTHPTRSVLPVAVNSLKHTLLRIRNYGLKDTRIDPSADDLILAGAEWRDADNTTITLDTRFIFRKYEVVCRSKPANLSIAQYLQPHPTGG